jgi:hypothetical protein
MLVETDDDSNRKYAVHPRIFGWKSIKSSTAYVLIGVSLLVGFILGGSPLFQGLLPGSTAIGVGFRDDGIDQGKRINYDNHIRDEYMPKPLSKHMTTSSSNMNTIKRSTEHRPRLLFMTATYTMDQLKAFQQTLDCMKDICNAGWNVTVHVQSASELTYGHPRYTEFQSRLWCVDSNSYVPLIIENYEKIGFGLNSRHRLFMRENIQNFDYFSFAEEDMLLTVSHLRAFVNFQSHLKEHLPKTYLRYTIGFLRYEDSTIDTERVSWEYRPSQIHVADMGDKVGKYLVTNNLNQAIYLLSQDQVIDLQDRCHFLTDIGQNSFYREMRKAMDRDWKYLAAGVSEWSSSFQQVLQCGMRRIIPVSHYEAFMIHHAVDKAQTRRPRKELLNAREFHSVIKDKMENAITIDEAYNTHIYNQYNLGLMDESKYKDKSIWSWGVDDEEPL